MLTQAETWTGRQSTYLKKKRRRRGRRGEWRGGMECCCTWKAAITSARPWCLRGSRQLSFWTAVKWSRGTAWLRASRTLFVPRKLVCLPTALELLWSASDLLLLTPTSQKQIFFFIISPSFFIRWMKVGSGVHPSPVLLPITWPLWQIINVTWTSSFSEWSPNNKPIHHRKHATNSPTGCITVEHLAQLSPANKEFKCPNALGRVVNNGIVFKRYH